MDYFRDGKSIIFLDFKETMNKCVIFSHTPQWDDPSGWKYLNTSQNMDRLGLTFTSIGVPPAGFASTWQLEVNTTQCGRPWGLSAHNHPPRIDLLQPAFHSARIECAFRFFTCLSHVYAACKLTQGVELGVFYAGNGLEGNNLRIN